MKSILIHLDDGVYNKLMKIKGEMTWKQFLLIGVKMEGKKNDGDKL